jgi:signal transduction histidine kinase
MQASNASNEFTGPEKILMIYISPPFWQTWWFKTLAGIVVIGIIYGFIRYRSRNLKKRNLMLEKKVNERTNELVERTHELHQSLSDLKTTQDQLIQSEKMASLGELTSGIAHEIKNPLNFINNFSELNMELITEIEQEQIPGLNDNSNDELASIIKTLRKNSEKINHHGKRVDDIVKSMLQHSRVGNLAKEAVNINALCEESLKLAYHGFKAKEKTFQAAFETDFDPELPMIMAIPQDLGRVLLNLINNAFYAVYEKKKKIQPVLTDGSDTESSYKPTVTVSTKKLDKKIAITISDNGTGISQKIISKIFQPFFTTKPTGEGTGLGLSMSYDIITKSHAGELHVKSTESKGTDFEIILPVQ